MRRRREYPYKEWILRSKAELEVAQNCDADGLYWTYETKTIPWTPPPVKSRSYHPDFIIKRKDGTTLYVEYKEFLDARSKRVLRYATKQNPELDIRILFGPRCTRKKISKRSKTTYGGWADKNKILHAEGRSIPEEWL
jgi:hypothetical protein